MSDKELERQRKNYLAKVRRYGGENLGVGIHYTQGYKDASEILWTIAKTCAEAEELAISRADRIEQLEATKRELVEALDKLLSVTRHLEPCAGTVDEVEVVLGKLRNQK